MGTRTPASERMNLLYANDQHGKYPDSWYTATATPLPPFPPLRGEARANLCVIGAGYTGLSAALHAAQAGMDVIVIDAQRVGFGASGRNGGQVGTTFNAAPRALAKAVGSEDAEKLIEMGHAAADLTRDLCAKHAPDASFKPGLVHADRTIGEFSETQEEVEQLLKVSDSEEIELLDRTALQEIVGSEGYEGGFINTRAGHLHPLRYAFGLARACVEAGVRIHEATAAHRVTSQPYPLVQTAHGRIRAENIIVATNGYGTGLTKPTASRVMPLNNFIVATQPLGDLAQSVLSRDVAVYDSRFVVNYFRLSEDKRLIFGGGETYGYTFPKDIAGLVRKPLVRVFPQLKDVDIDYAWGGTLAITTSRLPLITQPEPHIWAASGYSGQGVALAGFVGKIIADAVSGNAACADLLKRLPTRAFPGGGALRTPLLALAMTWYAMRDRLGG
ncbi:NAD(P)/FAD-dependent oxidoreductase [Litoreibacter roseus]|uniref:Gamma-glutamylputrescine oxidase n=1 Tax=Litoreibacter roseus TaxID=2601869 RepID=A0A6N6JHU1_9RHOB|nr:FAD-binding oxidoreductase [Litoreibacter roseus]GFE65911.1 gamma-glutamylputrescine oxidase [Litoreibacter roseus]